MGVEWFVGAETHFITLKHAKRSITHRKYGVNRTSSNNQVVEIRIQVHYACYSLFGSGMPPRKFGPDYNVNQCIIDCEKQHKEPNGDEPCHQMLEDCGITHGENIINVDVRLIQEVGPE